MFGRKLVVDRVVGFVVVVATLAVADVGLHDSRAAQGLLPPPAHT